jgi:RHS repeat-associated protein
MREDSDAGSEVIYLFADHLGSTSVTYRIGDGQVERQWYKPWGELRPGPGSSLSTDYQFQGQRNAGWGLYHFKARWFDSNLGRFAQADSIIPGMGLSIAWDRYAGMLNNPVRYIDPNGHRVTCERGENCAQELRLFRFTGERYWKALIKDEFGIIMSDEGGKPWDSRNLQLMHTSLSNVDKILNGKLESLVKGATFKLIEQDKSKGGQYHGETHTIGPTGIDFYTVGDDAIRQMNIYHEVGHLLDNVPKSKDVFMNAVENENSPSWVADGYINKDALISQRINDPNYALGPRAIQAYVPGAAEEWADAFANYVAGNIDLSQAQGPGADMYNFVTDALAPYTGVP